MTEPSESPRAFGAVVAPGERIDPDTIRQVGLEVASYLDDDAADGSATTPVHRALQGILDAPMHPDQLLNCALAMSNVVALLVLTLGQDEAAATELVNGVVGRAAQDSIPQIFPAGAEDPAHVQARALICRVYGTASASDMPEHLDGSTLAALAAYGDAAVVLADRIGLPRSVLAPAVEQALEQM